MSDRKFKRRFKELTAENWLVPDPTREPIIVHKADGSSERISDNDWAKWFLEIKLSPTVHPEVCYLFEVARGVLCYGCFFYPLYTLGCQELWRVMDAGTIHSCAALNAPNGAKTFSHRLSWLREAGHISAEQDVRWQATRSLRNMASHQERQSIFDPGMALENFQIAAELLNDLFDRTAASR